MPVSRLEYLFDCYLHQNCSVDEEAELMNLLADARNKKDFQKLIDDVIEKTKTEVQMPEHVAASILQNIIESGAQDRTAVNRKNVFSLTWMKVAAAACIILFVSFFAFWLFKTSIENKLIANNIASASKQGLIKPGGNHAVLTMADGQTIVLDSVQNGDIISGNSKIKKKGALLIYDGFKPLKRDASVNFNILSTPKGGQFELVLPDGSRVWLNALSSIRFPTAFTGSDRNVELTGEAYFEIAKNKKKPFHVKVKGMQVEVLGTHFNVNAYEDEGAIKTSLLEGSVKIEKGKISSLLKPGQQGVLKNGDPNIEIKKANMNGVIAWKEGLFDFDGADIKSIMRQIGRWYNVEIIYSGQVPERTFEGKISRNAQLSDVLKILALTNVEFTLRGTKIIIQ